MHYTLEQFDCVHAVAERFDAIVLAGDHLDVSGALSVDAQIVVILKYLQRIAQRTRVIVASGNHLTARNADGERVAGRMARVRDVGAATTATASSSAGPPSPCARGGMAPPPAPRWARRRRATPRAAATGGCGSITPRPTRRR